MGQKIHPLGLRLGVSQHHRAKWCTAPKNYAYFIQEDLRLRKAVVEIANARQSESLPPQRSSFESPRSSNKPAAKPTARKPAAKPTARKPAAKPTARKPAAKPTARKPAAKPAARKSTTKDQTSTLGALALYQRKLAKRLKPKANVRTMFHTSMFQASLGDPVEIGDIFIHRRRLHHDTDRSKGSLDVIEIYVHTTTPVQLIHGTDKLSLTKSVVRYQKALEQIASAHRPTGAPRVRVLLNVSQILKPDRTASVLASRLIVRLEKRENFRSALKRVLQEAREDSVDGIKIQISGRLNGAEIARTEWVRHGSVPLQTLRANLDYSYQTAKTTYGILGIKVWTYQRH